MKEKHQLTINNRSYIVQQLSFSQEDKIQFAVFYNEKLLCHIYLAPEDNELDYEQELFLVLKNYFKQQPEMLL